MNSWTKEKAVLSWIEENGHKYQILSVLDLAEHLKNAGIYSKATNVKDIAFTLKKVMHLVPKKIG